MRHYTGTLPASKTHPDRSWSFLSVDGGSWLGTLAIRQGKGDCESYDVEEDTSEPTPTYILRKRRDENTFYCVQITPSGVTCTCDGFRGRYHKCKHADAVHAVWVEGGLEAVAPYSEADAPPVSPWPYPEQLAEPAPAPTLASAWEE